MFGTKILEERESEYNGHLRVLRTWGMGTYIQAGGLTQSGGIVESIWKQTLKKINEKKINAKSILILGLGGGTLAKLLCKKYPNAKITGIEIDPIMIEFGRKYLNLDEYNIDIKIADATDYTLYSNCYDLVVVDTYLGDKFVDIAGSEPSMSKLTIFNRLFYKNKKKEALKFEKKLKKIYQKVDTFQPTANIMFFCYS